MSADREARLAYFRDYNVRRRIRPVVTEPCSVESCARPRRSGSSPYCSAHYNRLLAYGDLRPADPIGTARPRPTLSVPARFWAKVDMSGGAWACWPWTGGHDDSGYGLFTIAHRRHGRGRVAHAQRVAWELTHGPIPAGLQALHRCDNPPCVNPAHLFLGTHDDNMADRQAKGRTRAKLSPDQVRAIRRQAETGVTYVAIAAEYGVADTTVGRIVRRIERRDVAA